MNQEPNRDSEPKQPFQSILERIESSTAADPATRDLWRQIVEETRRAIIEHETYPNRPVEARRELAARVQHEVLLDLQRTVEPQVEARLSEIQEQTRQEVAWQHALDEETRYRQEQEALLLEDTRRRQDEQEKAIREEHRRSEEERAAIDLVGGQEQELSERELQMEEEITHVRRDLAEANLELKRVETENQRHLERRLEELRNPPAIDNTVDPTPNPFNPFVPVATEPVTVPAVTSGLENSFGERIESARSGRKRAR